MYKHVSILPHPECPGYVHLGRAVNLCTLPGWTWDRASGVRPRLQILQASSARKVEKKHGASIGLMALNGDLSRLMAIYWDISMPIWEILHIPWYADSENTFKKSALLRRQQNPDADIAKALEEKVHIHCRCCKDLSDFMVKTTGLRHATAKHILQC